MPAHRILLLTFTRRAAREMLGRATEAAGSRNAPWGGTFHSVAHRVIAANAAALGLRVKLGSARSAKRVNSDWKPRGTEPVGP